MDLPFATLTYSLLAAVDLLAVLLWIIKKPGAISLEKAIDVASHLLFAIVFALGACASGLGKMPDWPLGIKAILNDLLQPPVVAAVWLGGTFLATWLPRLACSRFVFWQVFNWGWFWLMVSLGDRNFAALVLAPDHIAVVALVFAVSCCAWLGLRLGWLNDVRLRQQLPPIEATPHEQARILVWPDLVYIELIAMLLSLAVLGIWSLCVQAPLEPPADPTWTPNPAKAPWYFVGIQELLVYFDPWLGGFMIPLVIILGLCVMPYLDPDHKMSGYYSHYSRRFGLSIFVFGLSLWVLLIILGSLFRGPDWQFYGLYESRAVRKYKEVQTYSLSKLLWRQFGLREGGTSVGEPPRLAAPIREIPGFVLLLAWFGGTAALIHRAVKLNWIGVLTRMRFWTFTLLIGLMFLIPLKMFANWLLHVSYFAYLPEIGLNI